MMGRQSRQVAMIFVDIESLIPETHLLRKIERMVSFNFIYDLLAPYYPATGRPSVDPVSMFKMLLIGYLYGIESERQSGGWWRKFSSTSPTDGFADLNRRGAVLRRVDRCREVLEIQGLQEIMLLNAAGLYYQILKL